MSDSNRNDGPFLATVLLFMIGVSSVWWFSDTFNLDMSTGAQVLGMHAILAVMAWVSWRFGEYSLFSFSNAWPVLLGLLWMAWWPALNHWAVASYPAFYNPDDISVWWAAWYTKFAGLVLLIAGGYGAKSRMPSSDY